MPPGIRYLFNDGVASHPVLELLPEEENPTDDVTRGVLNGNENKEGVAATITPSFVLDVTWPRVAVFYHPTSDACQDFTSKYIALARAVRHRSSRVPVAFHAVSCAVHEEVCAEFEIRAVPVVLGFKAGRVDGIALDRNQDNIIDIMTVADVLELNLGPADGRFESESGGGGSGGGEMGGDSSVMVAGGMAGSTTKHQAAAGGFNNKGTREGITPRHHHAAAAAAAAAVAAADPESTAVFSDAAASFVVSMEQTVYDPNGPADSPLSRELAYILREYLDSLHWTLPPNWRLHDLINDLRSDYDTVIKGRAELLRVLDRHRNPGDRPSWSRSCVRGQYIDRMETGGLDVVPEFSGYSCGLLRMFHISAIGVAQQHTRVLGDTGRVRPSHVATVYRDYIESFYGGSSRTLRRVFLESVDNCMFDLCGSLADIQADTPQLDPGWHELTMWLWNVHNHIRSSISSGVDVAAVSQEILWPTQQECPACFVTFGGVANDAIYEHIKSVYWPAGIQNPRIIVIKPWRGNRRALGRLRSAAGGVFADLMTIVLLGALGLVLRQYWIKNAKRMKEQGWTIPSLDTFDWNLPNFSIGSGRKKRKDNANGRTGLRSYAPGSRMRQRYGQNPSGVQVPRDTSSSGFTSGQSARSGTNRRNGGAGGVVAANNGRGSTGRSSRRSASGQHHATFMSV
mmetsp:Transcript_8410/g.23556  ORF Transcript_8410/g.23556 Transcript_8410/m.23556 type:complete len:683 (-) Transcript_8410:57-2105(-)